MARRSNRRKDIISEGLVGLNSPMLIHNRHHETEVSDKALGIRVTGCAGVELIALAKDKEQAIFLILRHGIMRQGRFLETLGLKMANIKGEPLSLNGRELFVGGTLRKLLKNYWRSLSIRKPDILLISGFFCKNENFCTIFQKEILV